MELSLKLTILLVVIFFLFCAVLGGLWTLMKRSRKVPVDAEAVPEEAAESSATRESTSSLFRSLIKGFGSAYNVPWFIILGLAGSGKSALMESLDSSEQSDPEKSAAVNWRLGDRAVAIECPGDAISGGPLWQMLMQVLLRYRPRSPVDAALVVVPADSLQNAGPGELSVTAAKFRSRLNDLQWKLGLCVPVYFVVTKADTLDGFREFAETLDGKTRDGILGWSNPQSLDQPFDPNWADEAALAIDHRFHHLQAIAFGSGLGAAQSVGLLKLTGSVSLLREPIREFLVELFRQSGYRQTFFLRGIYFTGDPNPGPRERARPSFFRDLIDRKILPEWGLAKPFEPVAGRRHRAAAWAQATATILLVTTMVGLYLGASRLSENRIDLELALRDVYSAIENYRAERKASASGDLLAQVERAFQEDFFRSPFIPSSYFPPTELERKIDGTLAEVVEAYVVRDVRKALVQKRIELRQPVAAVHEDESNFSANAFESVCSDLGTRHTVESVPEYRPILNYALALKNSEINRQRFNRLAGTGTGSSGDLDELDRYLHPGAMRTRLDNESQRAFDRTIRTIRNHELPDDSEDHLQRSRNLKNLIAAFYQHWFRNEYAVELANSAVDRIDSLRNGASVEQLHFVERELSCIDQIFHRPDSAWLGRQVFSTSILPGFDASMAQLPIGDEVKAYASSRGNEELVDLQAHLLGLQSDALAAPVLEIRDDQLELSADADAVRDNLRVLLQQEFVTAYDERVARALNPSAHVIWNKGNLQDALRLSDSASRYVSTTLKAAPPKVRVLLSWQVRSAASASIGGRLAAQRLVDPQELTRTSAGEEIRSLVDNREAIEMLLSSLRESDPGLRGLLIQILRNQTSRGFRVLDQELTTQEPYAVRGRTLTWWDGNGKLSLVAYGKSSSEDLEEYLAAEREQMRHLAEDLASPFLTFLDTNRDLIDSKDVPSLRTWTGIVEAFRKLKDKKPGNSVTALEEFIRAEMDKIAPSSCAVPVSAPDPQRSDFFLTTRDDLRRMVISQCRLLAKDDGAQSYRELARVFNRTLAGRFPFVSGNPEPEAPEASLRSIVAYYQLLDHSGKSTADFLARRGGDGAAAREFLDQMERLRPILMSLTSAIDTPEGASLDFGLEFRANRAQEIGANRIIEWRLDAGGNSYKPGATMAGRWRFGDPMRVLLRLAKDGPDLAATPSGASAGTTAAFDFPTNWSMFRLLRAQASASSDFDGQSDPKPHTLRFMVPLARKPDAADEPGVPALRAYLRVNLTAPGKKEPALVVGAFPSRAPELSEMSAAR